MRMLYRGMEYLNGMDGKLDLKVFIDMKYVSNKITNSNLSVEEFKNRKLNLIMQIIQIGFYWGRGLFVWGWGCKDNLKWLIVNGVNGKFKPFKAVRALDGLCVPNLRCPCRSGCQKNKPAAALSLSYKATK